MPTINILSKDNGAGASRSSRLLEGILDKAGFTTCRTIVSEKDIRRAAVVARQTAVPFTKRLKCDLRRWLARRALRQRQFDVNLFLETVLPDWFPAARFNCLIPNPEWFEPWWRQYLPAFDLVLCKTRHSEEMFREISDSVEFISFTSLDRFQADIPRDERAPLHVAGSSLQKGTHALVELWRRHPEWPTLVVVQRKQIDPPIHAGNIEFKIGLLDDAELRRLQNGRGIHLCPSETEGFGHYLVEALSCRAITITTDAPPMNEIIAPDRGLLAKYASTSQQRLATNYYFDPLALEEKIETAIHLDRSKRLVMSRSARDWFETNREFFRSRIVQLLSELVEAGSGEQRAGSEERRAESRRRCSPS